MSLTPATIPVFVPVVNRFDLLKLCLDSLSIRLTTEPVIINNSGMELPEEFHRHTILTPGTHWSCPESSLTFSQTQNLMLDLASKTKKPFYFFIVMAKLSRVLIATLQARPNPCTISKLWKLSASKIASSSICKRRKKKAA